LTFNLIRESYQNATGTCLPIYCLPVPQPQPEISFDAYRTSFLEYSSSQISRTQAKAMQLRPAIC